MKRDWCFDGWMKLVWYFLLFGSLSIVSFSVNAQCNALRPQIDISFNTDQDCAPVIVTQFTITYYFNTPQDPNDIEIVYEWNDPGNNVDIINIGNGLIAGPGNLSFTANAPSFTYFDNNGQCNISPTASIIIGGVFCPSSSQTQLAFFWGTDEQANANVSMTPANWEVCYDNAIVNATFFDTSDFNCNINVEPDNPNRFARHVQFVYGTNHNPALAIRDLSLNDGAVQGLTDGAGNLVAPSTRGTGTLITGAYFGPIDAIPFPADGPVSFTYPMSAPANAANLVGHRFEVTLFNWNICNPWNGDPINPNYGDAVTTTGYIIIVDAPAPNFITRNSGGTATKNFCINEVITFDNETPNINGYNYTWEFYDDAGGVYASRLWWLLRWLGHDHCQLLDGGLPAWLAAGFPLRSGDETVPAQAFIGVLQAGLTVDAQALLARTPEQVLIDVRGPARYAGREEPIDPIAGHIPGAINLPFTGNLAADGRFLPAEALRARYAAVGNQAVSYCGSGVTACHAIFAMALAGLPPARLYPGSWSEWITDAARPIAVGEQP